MLYMLTKLLFFFSLLTNISSTSHTMLNIEDISSPIGAQMFEFSESELFPETLQNSEVASSSNCCYEDHSSYPIDVNKYNSNIDNETMPATTAIATAAGNGHLSIIFDSAEDQLENDDISASIDFTTSPFFPASHQYFNSNNSNQEPFGMSSFSNQYPPELRPVAPPPTVPILGPPLPTAFDQEECLPSMPSYMIGPYLPNVPFSAENSGILAGNGLLLGTDFSHQELEFQGDNGLFIADAMAKVFNCSNELQALSSTESQYGVHGGGSNTTPLASEISSLEDGAFKVGKLSVEERKRKIHRYMKKRNERNFSKKIKYACRKTLADSRPRVRGRFAKNDETGEFTTPAVSNHDDDTDHEDHTTPTLFSSHHQHKVVKEEDILDSSDIFAHISGVNSFKCNYPIQSWI